MNKVGDGLSANRANWNFSNDVVQHFDVHIKKSVPLYNEGHQLICDIADFFIQTHSVVYEIGCSTGSLSIKLAEHNKDKPEVEFIGIDKEQEMISVALQNNAANQLNVTFQEDDIISCAIKPCDLIICYYTIQFIHPSVRQAVIDKLYRMLNWGGGLILFEKVRAPDARFQDMMSTLYTDFKLRQGYTPEDIVNKSRSLKGVLEPFSTQGNLDLLSRAGFVDIMTVQKYLCFEGFLAIK